MRGRARYTPPLYLDFFSMRRDNKIGWDDFILAFLSMELHKSILLLTILSQTQFDLSAFSSFNEFRL